MNAHNKHNTQQKSRVVIIAVQFAPHFDKNTYWIRIHITDPMLDLEEMTESIRDP